jgi:hypothetical protein
LFRVNKAYTWRHKTNLGRPIAFLFSLKTLFRPMHGKQVFVQILVEPGVVESYDILVLGNFALPFLHVNLGRHPNIVDELQRYSYFSISGLAKSAKEESEPIKL